MTIMPIMLRTVMIKMFMILLVGSTILRLSLNWDGVLIGAIGAMRSKWDRGLVGLLFETGYLQCVVFFVLKV